MAAVYGVIRNHEGWISVDSDTGKGTTVHIYLPAVSEEVTPEAPRGGADDKGKRTVLLVEDEETVLDVTRTMLEKLGHRVLTAESAKEALSIAREFEGTIHLALLDVVLPDMSGRQTYSLLAEARPGMKVIICSGRGLEGQVNDTLAAGAQDFIQKPFLLEVLSAKIRKVLEEE
jgi:DNA-binding NtrC family response regulator